MVVVLDLDEVSACLKILNDKLTSLVSVHACILGIILSDLCIRCENIYNLKAMSESDLKVVRIVCRCDLNYTCTEFNINVVVCNDRDPSANERKDQHLADHVLVSLILGVNCNRCIAKECLRSCCSKLNIACTILKGISQMPEVTGLILILNLSIGD